MIPAQAAVILNTSVLELSWEAITDALNRPIHHYQIFMRYTQDGRLYPLSDELTTTSYRSKETMHFGAVYSFVVRAFDQDGNYSDTELIK